MLGTKLVLGALVILNALIYQSNAATCTAFTTQSTCTQTSICAWSSSSSVCYCNVATNLEVVFVMDSSGSVKSWGWDQEKLFVRNIVTTGLSPGSYVGIVTFASDSYKVYRFNNNQNRNTIANFVDDLDFLESETATLDAVDDCVDIIRGTTRGLPRIMFLITDGNPNPSSSQNPCGNTPEAATVRAELLQYDITTLLITVGPKINAGTLSCLYGNDQSRVISANNFSAAALAAIRAKTDAYLCPTYSDLRIGEVRLDPSPSGNPGGNSRFLELYNHGQIIDFAGNNLVLTGYVTGTISSGVLKNGQRLIIYDKTGSAATDLKCGNCTCSAEETNSAGTLTDSKCTNAVYIGCGDSGASCTFNTAQMSNSYWKQKVTDTVDGAVWVDLTHDNNGNKLATVGTGFSFEVKDVTEDASTAANWQQSCLMYGTPGDKPLTTCPATCSVEGCRAGGDTAATCGSNGVCDCTQATHYYTDQLQCLLLPPPSNCKTYIQKEGSNQVATVAWTVAPLTEDHQYDVAYTFEGAPASSQTAYGSGITYIVYGGLPAGINVATDPAPTVKTVIVSNNEEVESVDITCPFETLSPTVSPTPSPTLRPTTRPTNQPSHNPTLRPTSRPTTPPTLRPTALPTLRPSAFPTTPGYTITSCHISVVGGTTDDIIVEYTLNRLTTVSDEDESLSLELNVDGSTAQNGAVSLDPADGSPQAASLTDAADYNSYYLWPKHRMYPINGPFTGYSRGTLCTLETASPTPAPTKVPTPPTTKKPTKAPTAHPTNLPSVPPTKKPTTQDIVVDSCVVTLGRADSTGAVTSLTIVFVEPTYNYPITPSYDNVAYRVSWGTTDGKSFGVSAKGSGEENTANPKNLIITADDVVTIRARTLSPSADAGPAFECQVLTLSPTPAPTQTPHPPTPAPVLPNIDLVLDNSRCSAGTEDEVGRTIYACRYEVSQGAYSLGVEITTGSINTDLTFNWEITFDSAAVEPNYELGDNDAIAPESDFGFLSGSNIIEASARTGSISLLINAKSNADVDAEVAWLTLTQCIFDEDDTCTIAESPDHQKTYRIEIVNESNEKQESSGTLGDMPTWIWYPVAAGVLMLAGLAAFGYMYYNKRKLAEEQLQRREADLANAEELDNLENFGGLGDNINFNPIATAGTQDVATGGEYIDKQLAKQQKNAEFAQVDVDKEVWRQDFGQIKADRHDV